MTRFRATIALLLCSAVVLSVPAESFAASETPSKQQGYVVKKKKKKKKRHQGQQGQQGQG
jgi:hypothetical protein